MRISNALRYDTMTNDVNVAEANLFTTQQQVTTGLKFTQPSQDPNGTTQVLQINSMKSQLNQFQSNLQHATSALGDTNQSLTSISTLMESAYQLGLQGANTSIDAATRAQIAQQVDSLQTQLVSLGNSQGSDGQYVFGGQKTNSAPFSATNGVIAYAGDNNSMQVQGGPNASITTNLPGAPLITDAYNALQSLKSDLQSGSLSNVSVNDLSAVQSSMTAIQQAQGTVGARVQQVQTLTGENTQRVTDLTSQASNVQDVDIAKALTDYDSARTAYQAALSMESQIGNLSLASYLGSGTPA